VAVGGQPELLERCAFEVEFDEDSRLVADHPRIVTGFHGHDVWGGTLQRAPVGIADVDTATREEAYVRVLACLTADERFHVRGPAEAWRIYHALDAGAARSHDVEHGATDLAVVSSRKW
jgi:hypothetical protein